MWTGQDATSGLDGVGLSMKIEAGMTIVYDDKDVYVTESMLVNGSLSCMTCNEVCGDGVMINGHLFWICEYGHENDIEL